MRLLLAFVTCVFSLSIFSVSGHAENSNEFQSPNTLSFGDNLQSEPQEFLTVEEAYHALINVTDTGLDIAWQIEPGYYLYQERFHVQATPLDSRTPDTESSVIAEPLAITPNFEAGKTKYDEYFEKDVTVYYLQTHTPIDWPAVLANTETIALRLTSQGCADAGLCYPPHHNYFELNKTSGQVNELTKSQYDQLTGKSTSVTSALAAPPANQPFILSQWLWVLVLATAGGTILNLMPCVFPVLSIKALKLANTVDLPNSRHLHGWAYTAGAIFTFVAVAAIMLFVRSAGNAVGWGFQLQSPIVISLLAYLFFTMGLSFSGMIQLGSQLMGVGQSTTGGNKYSASFFTGALAAVVASPCTAPMMGTALGYAITQPATVALTVFAALGFGMALPFLLLTYSPALAKWLPAPGPWMNTLKQAMAFPLYLTAVWLLWVLGRQTDSSTLVLVACGFVAIAFALWLGQQSTTSATGKWLKYGFVAIATTTAIMLVPDLLPSDKKASSDIWQTYSAAELSKLRKQGKPVFINLTADWCITCIANERVALHTDEVESAFSQYGVVTLKGDWTTSDPEITRLLKDYGRNGVPLYLMFPADGSSAKILPQLLTKKTVISAIKAATPDKIVANTDL